MPTECKFIGFRNIVRVTIHNRCNCMGQYYAEDDWSIIGNGDTYDDAIANAARDNRLLGIQLDHSYLEIVGVLVWIDEDGETVLSDADPTGDFYFKTLPRPRIPSDNTIWNDLTTHPIYLDNLKRLEAAAAKAEQEKVTAEKAKREVRERAELARLLACYGTPAASKGETPP
jgi:hypothetical protein